MRRRCWLRCRVRWRRQRLIGIAIALVLIVGACLIPGSEALGREGIITLGALLALAVLWIAGNWVPALNVTVVALVGLVAMFLPGMSLLTWKEFQDAVPWGIVLMCCTIMSIGGVVTDTGGAKFLVDLVMGRGVTDMGFYLCMFILFTFVYLLHTVCPIGVATLDIFVPILIAVCATFGASPAVPTIALAIAVAGNVLLPVNPMVMLTYGEGYYTFADTFKTSIVPAFVLQPWFLLHWCQADKRRFP